jgi:hypothetical protein
MMKSRNTIIWLTVAALCTLILTGGCGPKAEPPIETNDGPTQIQPPPPPPPTADDKPIPIQPPTGGAVTLALKFTQGSTTTYKLTSERTKSVEFEGTLADNDQLKGGKTGDTLEMAYDQTVESVDAAGNATVKITIKSMKFKSVEKDAVRLEFDSTQNQDKSSPLAKLIGKGYKITLSPQGKVVDVIDPTQARTAVRGSTPADKLGASLLKDDVIKRRHSLSALPPAGSDQLKPGQDWSNVKTMAFGLMGNRSFERIYVLKEVKDDAGKQVAVVEMSAIPTSDTPDDSSIGEAAENLSKMFDNVDAYNGSLELDVATGTVVKYSEELMSEWIIVDPAAQPNSETEPDSLRMTATRVHRVERVGWGG